MKAISRTQRFPLTGRTDASVSVTEIEELTDSGLREEVREWLVDASYGVISQEDLVARADAAIAKLDAPPHYLTAISLGRPLSQLPRLDLIKDQVAHEDLYKLAGRLLQLFDHGQIAIPEIAAIAFAVCDDEDRKASEIWEAPILNSLDDKTSDAMLLFFDIREEIDPVEIDEHIQAGLEDRVRSILQNAAAYADK